MKRYRKLKWCHFEYNDDDWYSEEALSIRTSNNSDDDCYLTKEEASSLYKFLRSIFKRTEKVFTDK